MLANYAADAVCSVFSAYGLGGVFAMALLRFAMTYFLLLVVF